MSNALALGAVYLAVRVAGFIAAILRALGWVAGSLWGDLPTHGM